MKIKVSDYVANFFAENGITTVFTVVGGGAMHMNDSFGHHSKIQCIYNHHEQASAIAAEAYYRVNNQMAGVCVTSGPGAINALNGVVGAYQDSIPMIVISGQTKSTLMTRMSGLNLRTLGNQEFDIMSTLSHATKYAETVMEPQKIRFCLEKALYYSINGRPGPCWIEIPLDVQGQYIETDVLEQFNPVKSDLVDIDSENEVIEKINTLISRLKNAKRPVLYAGNGIRISNAKKMLDNLVSVTGIPVVTCWDSIDLIETENEYYVGRAGIMGDRAGNFAVQNSDLLIAIGNRLNIYQVGYQIESWARESFIVDVDIDRNELKKNTIRLNLPICYDAKKFIELLVKKLEDDGFDKKNDYLKWVKQCCIWKEMYPVVQKRHYQFDCPINVYAFVDSLSRSLPEGAKTVVANGSASVVGSAAYYIKNNQRFIMNCALSSMGYDLPAAVGACVANDGEPIVCIAGDGSIMMNLQELQTIVTNKLPVKIVLLNNNGYHQIRITQTNLFKGNYVGIGPQSGDLGFPDFKKIADAFGIPYRKCNDKANMQQTIEWLIAQETACLVEVICSTSQFFEPKSATKRLEDGSLYSPPLEDLYPFLDKTELKKNMYIPLYDER